MANLKEFTKKMAEDNAFAEEIAKAESKQRKQENLNSKRIDFLFYK